MVIWLRPGTARSNCVFCWSSGCRKSLARTLRLAAGDAGGFGVVGALASLADFEAASSPTGKGRASAARRARRRAGGADLATAFAILGAAERDDDDDGGGGGGFPRLAIPRAGFTSASIVSVSLAVFR